MVFTCCQTVFITALNESTNFHGHQLGMGTARPSLPRRRCGHSFINWHTVAARIRQFAVRQAY